MILPTTIFKRIKMNTYHVINYHITNHCNYHCAYCFGKFDVQTDPSIDDAKQVVDNVASYFAQNNITNGRINFAGGEPLLYNHLDELIEYTADLGIEVSLVTNGSLLTPERIKKFEGKVSCIGISIDSISQTTNLGIGRCCKEKTISLSQWKEVADAIHNCGIKLKINTVVSHYNINENLLPLYEALRPDRIKFLQMHIVNGVNDHAADKTISIDKFQFFCERYDCLKPKSEIIPEKEGAMENSYLMIDPNSDFLLNDNGRYHLLGSCLTESISDILAKAPLSREKFESRYEGGVQDV